MGRKTPFLLILGHFLKGHTPSPRWLDPMKESLHLRKRVTIPFGLLFRLIYGIVGKKVEQLARSVPRDGEDPVHALIVNGILQAPGLATIKDNGIVVEPISGERVAVHLADIASVHEVFWFNGAGRLYKVGFWLSVLARQRLGVAISRVHADAWRNLHRPDTPMPPTPGSELAS